MHEQIRGWITGLYEPAQRARLQTKFQEAMDQLRQRIEALRDDPWEAFAGHSMQFLRNRTRRQWMLIGGLMFGLILMFSCGLLYRADERLGQRQVAAAQAAVDSKEIRAATVYCTHLLSVPDGRRDIVGHSVERDTLEETVAREANWVVTKDWQVDESYCFDDWAAVADFMTGGVLIIPEDASEADYTLSMLEFMQSQGSTYRPPKMPWNR